MRNRVLAALVSTVLALATHALAQTGTGKISGNVEDRTGGVIVGAAIKVTSESTGTTRSTTTSSSGTFVVPSLSAGVYTVKVEFAGFSTYVVPNVEVTVGADHPLRIVLEPGSVTSTVEVSAAAVQVQTTESSISSLVDPKTLVQLPLNKRNPLHLLGLIPGVTGHSATGTSSSGTVTHHVNGGRGRGIITTLDGIDIGDPVIPRGELTHVLVNPDMLKEFRVTTALSRAEYGRGSEAQIEMATKSGGNKFHGTAYEFFRNTALDANSFFNNQSNDPFTRKPPTAREKLQHNQFGGGLSGPILKNKLFFFGGYDAQRREQAFSRSSLTLTKEARQGFFRYVADATAPLSPSLVDPATGALMPGVTVSTYDIVANDRRDLGLDPSMKALINLYPFPNDFSGSGVDGLNIATFRWNAPTSNPIDSYVAKVDYNISPKYEFFARYTLSSRSDLIGDFINSALARTPSTVPGRVRLSRPQGAAVGLKMLWSPRLVNDARIGFTRNKIDFSDPSHPMRTGDPIFSKVPELRTNTNTMNPPFIYWGGTARYPEHLQINDNLSWQRGLHFLRLGGDFRLYRFNNVRNTGSNPGGSGISVFPSVFFGDGVLPFTGKDPETVIANTTDQGHLRVIFNELLGIVTNVDQVMYSNGKQYVPGNGLVMYQRQREAAFFGQDDWKLTPRLTLNFGLRYELFGVPYDKGGLQVVPDRPLNQGPVTFLPAGPGTGRSWYKASYNNFAPALGFAWDPQGNGKMAIRGGYRMNYNRMVGWALNVVEQRQPGVGNDPQLRKQCLDPAAIGGFRECTSASTEQPMRLTDLSRHPGVVVINGLATLKPPAGIISKPGPDRRDSPFFFDDNFKTARVHQFSLSIQREIAPNTVAEIAYVGNRGVNLFRFINVNQIELRTNGFLAEFIKAQNNLRICEASPDCQNSFANQGLPGQVDLPIFTALFGEDSSVPFTNSTSLSNLRTNAVATMANAMDRGDRGSKGPQAAGLGGGDRFFRPNPQFDVAGIGASNSLSWYNSLQAQIRANYRGGLQFAANYTFSKSLDDASDETVGAGTEFSFPFDSKNPGLNKARSDYDINHVFRAYAIYDLPFGRGRHFGGSWHPVVNHVLGGWQVNTILDISSGFPFTVTSGSSTFNYFSNLDPADCSPEAFGAGGVRNDTPRGVRYFDVGSGATRAIPDVAKRQRGLLFNIPEPGAIGTCGRNTFTGPGFAQVDLGVFKSFSIREGSKLEFRGELFNAFNHANFSNPTTNIQATGGTFGKITGTRAPNRVVQFALKFYF